MNAYITRTILIVAISGLPAVQFAVAAESSNPVQSLAGRFDLHHRIYDEGDHNKVYWGDDVAEIVPVSADAAYVRVSLIFTNGHICDIWGVASAQYQKLVYRDPTPALEGRPRCVLSIWRDGKSLRIDDDRSSCDLYCGVRGSLTNVRLPFSSKRPIHYMAALKAARQFRGAMEEWQSSGGH